jgi:two-component system NtrC family sensor kinase
VLGLAKAIYNQESCYIASCHFHPENFKVLGVLDITVSLEHNNTLISAFRNKIIALTLFLLALLWLSMTFFTQKLVNKPVKFLLQHTKLLARGELDATVKYISNDELGELADAFNTMTINLRMARNELEEWGRNLEAKVEERTSEVRQIQAQLVRSEKLASLGELVAGIAHEINNPLTGIMVFASLLSNDPKLNPDLRSDLETITRQAERCARIVKGLLEFSRESTPHKQPASLNDIMDATFALIGNQASFHDITVSKDYGMDIPEVMVDPNLIEQVFVNILLNASHAMPDGGELRINSGVSPETTHVYMKINDTGCGIPEEHLKKIFDPFFTTKETKGTGLGLSVSYGIIESHGGKIEVESTVGVGTTFTVKLPIEKLFPAELLGVSEKADHDDKPGEQGLG